MKENTRNVIELALGALLETIKKAAPLLQIMGVGIIAALLSVVLLNDPKGVDERVVGSNVEFARYQVQSRNSDPKRGSRKAGDACPGGLLAPSLRSSSGEACGARAPRARRDEGAGWASVTELQRSHQWPGASKSSTNFGAAMLVPPAHDGLWATSDRYRPISRSKPYQTSGGIMGAVNRWMWFATLSSRHTAIPLRFAPPNSSTALVVLEPTTAEREPFRLRRQQRRLATNATGGFV